tara:strand:- start:1427 stop:1657 length:231 start_codon:yes stop_codon:yes gene_type:complete
VTFVIEANANDLAGIGDGRQQLHLAKWMAAGFLSGAGDYLVDITSDQCFQIRAFTANFLPDVDNLVAVDQADTLCF